VLAGSTRRATDQRQPLRAVLVSATCTPASTPFASWTLSPAPYPAAERSQRYHVIGCSAGLDAGAGSARRWGLLTSRITIPP
jgi:hypothetical protein